MATKIGEIFDMFKIKYNNLAKQFNEIGFGYKNEIGFYIIIKKLGNELYQGPVVKVPKSKNEFTSSYYHYGQGFLFQKSFLAQPRGYFNVSSFLQE